jgi:tetratricopeptide (TPR) repeat protein
LPDLSGAESRLALLRRRWEGEHSASAFLPLAEEFRRVGRLSEAIEVLESGLRAFPWHTSAQVALGRCRLESGDVAAAVAALENIIRQDPTHLVASKLLVEAYLRSGRPEEARARLDAYAALNERDPEIERLRARLAGPAPPADIFRLPVPAVPAPDLSALGAPRRPREPFPGLGGARALRRYLEGLAAEGIFRLRLREVAPPAAPPAPAPAIQIPVAAPAPPPAAPEAVPTVTLGELYLRQGHAGEAEGIFHHVLGLEPDNRRAQRGLEEARVAAAAPAGRAGRKVRALRAYLERLRRGAQHVS